jgi:hypothetical protein
MPHLSRGGDFCGDSAQKKDALRAAGAPISPRVCLKAAFREVDRSLHFNWASVCVVVCDASSDVRTKRSPLRFFRLFCLRASHRRSAGIGLHDWLSDHFGQRHEQCCHLRDDHKSADRRLCGGHVADRVRLTLGLRFGFLGGFGEDANSSRKTPITDIAMSVALTFVFNESGFRLG